MSRLAIYLVLTCIVLIGGCGKSTPTSPPPGYKDPADPANMPAMPQKPEPVSGEPSKG